MLFMQAEKLSMLKSEWTDEEVIEISKNYKDINVSLAQDSIYQSCVHLIFGEENSENRGHSRNINRQRIYVNFKYC